jgi:hypothetical protein
MPGEAPEIEILPIKHRRFGPQLVIVGIRIIKKGRIFGIQSNSMGL